MSSALICVRNSSEWETFWKRESQRGSAWEFLHGSPGSGGSQAGGSGSKESGIGRLGLAIWPGRSWKWRAAFGDLRGIVLGALGSGLRLEFPGWRSQCPKPRSSSLHPHPKNSSPMLTGPPPKQAAESVAWDCPLPFSSTFLVAVDAIPLGTAEAQVRLRNEPTSPKPNTPPFPAALKNCVSSLSEKKKKKKKRNRCLKSSWGREEVGLPQHPPPAPLTSPSGASLPFFSPKTFPKTRQTTCRPRPGRWVEILGYSAGGETGRSIRSPFMGRGTGDLGAGEEGWKEGNRERRRYPLL